MLCCLRGKSTSTFLIVAQLRQWNTSYWLYASCSLLDGGVEVLMGKSLGLLNGLQQALFNAGCPQCEAIHKVNAGNLLDK